MNYILLLLLLIAYLLDKNLLPNKKNIQSNFKNFINKPIIWIYIDSPTSSIHWSSFYGRNNIQDLSSLSKLCITNTINKNKDFSIINIITDANINEFVPKFPWCDERIDKDIKLNYLKYYVLYNYGGLWVTPDTLVFNNFNEIFNKLHYYDLVLIKNLDTNTINDTIIACNKYSTMIKKILVYVNSRISQHNYYFNNNIEILLTEMSGLDTIYSYNNNINGKYDYNTKIITTENLLSTNITLFRNPDKVEFIQFNEKKITLELKNNWILRMNQKQLLETNMWISKLLRFSLDKDQKFYHEDYFKTILQKNSYNLFPTNQEIIETSKHISSPYSPYIVVTKDTSRNT